MQPDTGNSSLFYITRSSYNPGAAEHGVIFCRLSSDGRVTQLCDKHPENRYGAGCFHPIYKNYYYCGVATVGGHSPSPLCLFNINRNTGELTELASIPGYPKGVGQVAISYDGKYLVCAGSTGLKPDQDRTGIENGTAAYILLYGLNQDGTFKGLLDKYMIEGSGPRSLQKGSMPHCMRKSNVGEFFACCDLGADKIWMFEIDRLSEKIRLCGGTSTIVNKGLEPRIGAFHPDRAWFFSNFEAQPFVASYSYDSSGILSLINMERALDFDWPEDSDCLQSDLTIHPSGNFIYSLIRAINYVSVFSVNPHTGSIKHIQSFEIGANYPMGIKISPDGRYAVITAKKGGRVYVYQIEDNGFLLGPVDTFEAQFPDNIVFIN